MKSTNYVFAATFMIFGAAAAFLYGLMHHATIEGSIVGLLMILPGAYCMMKAEEAEERANQRRLVKYN